MARRLLHIAAPAAFLISLLLVWGTPGSVAWGQDGTADGDGTTDSDGTAQVDDIDLEAGDPTDPIDPVDPVDPAETDGADGVDVMESTDEAPKRAAPADDTVAMAEFRRELRTVEEGVSSLKERVFRSKATLELLKELVIDAAASGSRVVLWHVNKLGAGYSMESVQYFLDGKNVFSRVDPEGSLDEEREIKLHEQTVPPGTHELGVSMVLRGRGYKIFSYMSTFQFKLQSSYTFKVEDGMVSLIRVVADSRSGFRNFVERPTVQYDERTEAFREE